MWINRAIFDTLQASATTSATEARVLSEQLRAWQTTMDWMRVRLNQVEAERAALLFNYTGVKILTPTIAPAHEVAPQPDMLGATIHYGDIGDEEAAKQGIFWDLDGTVKYST